MKFCKAFNAGHAGAREGRSDPDGDHRYADRSFSSPPRPPGELPPQEGGRIQKGSSETGKVTAGTIRRRSCADREVR